MMAMNDTDADEIVQLNVGGVMFTAFKDTLVHGSGYFRAFTADRWTQFQGETFLDHDPDAFRVLLNCIRIRSLVPLPCESNPTLAKSVLLQAHFFAVDWLLAEIKETALRNHAWPAVPPGEPMPGVDDPVAEFDSRFGGVEDAIKSGILPALLLGPRRTDTSSIKQLLPYANLTRPDSWVVFYRNGEEVERFPPLCYALVEKPGRGNNMYTHIEPVVVSRNTRNANEMQNRSSDTDLQFVTASDWLEAALRNEGPSGGATNYDEWAYEQVLPTLVARTSPWSSMIDS